MNEAKIFLHRVAVSRERQKLKLSAQTVNLFNEKLHDCLILKIICMKKITYFLLRQYMTFLFSSFTVVFIAINLNLSELPPNDFDFS